jgi:DNA-binding response OmpR family regulator
VPRILLIEDDDALRDTLRKTFARAGYEVDDAPNGRAALQAYGRVRSDVVITDIVMPDKEGLETISELRRLAPNTKIIAISGAGIGRADDYLGMARRLGASRILAKPFSGDEILAIVAEVLAQEG